MTDYKKLLSELFEKYDEELAFALDGDIEKYCYKEAVSDEQGTHDANYSNRLRLAYTISYTKKYEEHIRIDGLIVRLFNEELFDRETNSFQGIGSCLEILAQLLNKYEVPNREILFEQARNANFDCACGFDSICTRSQDILPFDSYKIEDAIDLLIELKEENLALNLLKEYTYLEDITDEIKMAFCKSRFHILKDKENELEASKKLMNMSILTGDNFSICCNMLDMIELLNSRKEYNEASRIFDMLIPRLHSVENWYQIGLGRRSLEQCMDIILNCEDLAEDLWEWSEPFLKKIIDDMHGNLYKKASFAAYKVGDFIFSEVLSDKYDELMSPLG